MMNELQEQQAALHAARRAVLNHGPCVTIKQIREECQLEAYQFYPAVSALCRAGVLKGRLHWFITWKYELTGKEMA
jgi:hypothetical protein